MTTVTQQFDVDAIKAAASGQWPETETEGTKP